jgi:hypothetical protein
VRAAPDPLDAALGGCDVMEGVAAKVASSTPLRLAHGPSTGCAREHRRAAAMPSGQHHDQGQ